MMKNIIISAIFLVTALSINGQGNRTNILQDLEKSRSASQNSNLTATMNSASRLFGDKNDLTSVITIIPSGSVVQVTGSDSTFLRIIFEDTEGFIFARHAVIDRNTQVQSPPEVRQEQVNTPEAIPVGQQKSNRFSYLENKYGSAIAARLYARKIWKGMSSEMVQDSWGSPQKIDRVINGSIVREEWTYNNTWLFIQNKILSDWGALK